MSVFRKAAEYLGLVDDEDDEVYEYESYDDYGDEAPPARPAGPRARAGAPVAEPAAAAGGPSASGGAVTLVRPIRPESPSADVPARSLVSAKVHVLEPHGFNDAQEVGDRLKGGQPVVLNLQGLDRDLQRRLIDFSSGLCYALSGAMAKAADHVFLLTPPNVDVSDDDKERLRDRGLYRR